MDDVTIRVTFGLAGFVLGHILGWTSRAAVDADAVRKAVMDEPEPKRRWRPTRTDVVLWVLIAISLFSGFTAWGQYERNESLTARVDRMATCTAGVLSEQLRATAERTTYTEESARRNLELQEAQRDMLAVFVDPKATPEQGRAALAHYVKAHDAYVAVQRKAAKNRQAWPYPTQEEIDRCRT